MIHHWIFWVSIVKEPGCFRWSDDESSWVFWHFWYTWPLNKKMILRLLGNFRKHSENQKPLKHSTIQWEWPGVMVVMPLAECSVCWESESWLLLAPQTGCSPRARLVYFVTSRIFSPFLEWHFLRKTGPWCSPRTFRLSATLWRSIISVWSFSLSQYLRTISAMYSRHLGSRMISIVVAHRPILREFGQ